MRALRMIRIKAFAGNKCLVLTTQTEIERKTVATQVKRYGARRMRQILRITLALAILWPLLAWLAARALIVRAEVQRPADAIVVLGGSSTYIERTRRAAELFKAGDAPQVILTDDNQRGGWSSAEQRNPYFVERATAELREAGVPADRIKILPEKVSSTYKEALALRRYTAEQHLNSVLVVTSAYHSRRALWTLRQVFAGSNVKIGLEPVAPGLQTPTPTFWWLQSDGWSTVAGEYLKFCFYVTKIFVLR